MSKLPSWISVFSLFAICMFLLPGCSPPPEVNRGGPKNGSGTKTTDGGSITTDVADSPTTGTPPLAPVEEEQPEEAPAEEPTEEPPAEEPAKEEPADEEMPAIETTDEPETSETPETSADEATADANWGTIKGRLVFDGPIPEAPKANISKDEAICGKFDVLDESLLVGENGGVANAVISLYLGRGDEVPEAHPMYAETAEAKVSLDNQGCRFEPHICVLRTTQTLLIGNKDEVGHNTKIDCFSNDAINPIVQAGEQTEAKFTEPERVPIPVSCSIHPWMKGHIVIRNHPYTVVSNGNGEFQLQNLPVGTWTLNVWHEKPGNVTDVTIDGEATEWSKGRVELEVKPGINDLGEIKLSPAMFEE